MNIGAVSWIRKGTYYDNARLLAGHVDYVELLVYTWDEPTRALLDKELPLLRSLPLAYSVHLPTDTMQRCRRAYDFFHARAFPVRHFVLHPLPGWQNFIRGKSDVYLENLIDAYPLHRRMTIDIGHLMLGRSFPIQALNEPARVRVANLHMHGVWRGKDHCMLNEETIRYLRDMRRRFPAFAESMDAAPITFEVFHFQKLLSSIRRYKDAF